MTILHAQGEEKAQRDCFSAVTLLMLLTILLYAFAGPILSAFGARGETLALSAEYARVIALGAVFQLLATGFIPFIRNMGSVSFAMAAMILGFVTNVTLDYAFVWVFSWGMAGAAWATILGQAVTMIAAVAFFLFRRYRVERLPVKSLRACWGETLKVALSPFGLTFSPTVTMLLMNRFLLLYGSEQSVAVYGCIGYITAIIYLLLQGVGDGCQPLISRYYGERNEADGRRMRSLAYRTALVVSAACMAAVFLAREKVGVLFGASETANAGVAQVLPYFLSTLLFLAFVRITTSCFYATEKTRLSYILVYAEPVCTLLFLLTLPLGLKLTGVWLAVPLAQTAAFLIALLAKRRVERV